MTMLLGQLIQHCRDCYNSADGDDFFPESWFITTIWRAESELAIQGWVIERSFSTLSVAGTRAIAFPTNCLAIKEAKYDYKDLTKLTIKDDPKSDVIEPTGNPSGYAIWNNTIYLFPTPADSDKVIECRAYMAPDQLTVATSPLNVPDEYQIQLVDFVLAQMAAKDQNLQLSNFHQQKWEQIVERARQQRRKRLRADKYFVVKNTYFDGVEDWSNGYW